MKTLLNKRGALLGLVLILLFAAGGGLFAFLRSSSSFNSSQNNGKKLSEVKVADPVLLDRPHPISGVLYTDEAEEKWTQRRPVAVMIDNHLDSRPPTNISQADIVYEAVAEGGITRLVAVYHSSIPSIVGPVRSARIYYIDWALEFGAYYSHVGGAVTPGSAANAYTYMFKNNVLDVDQFKLGSRAYWRDTTRSAPHNMYTDVSKLITEGEKLYPTSKGMGEIKSWKFKAEEVEGQRGEDNTSIRFNFWDLPAYAVEWVYERESNTYLRNQGGVAHVEVVKDGKEIQLRAKNIVLVRMNQKPAYDGTAHILYTTIGSGDAQVYMDGKMTDAFWKRKELSDRMRFYDKISGSEIEFNRGQTWVEIVPK